MKARQNLWELIDVPNTQSPSVTSYRIILPSIFLVKHFAMALWADVAVHGCDLQKSCEGRMIRYEVTDGL